MSGVRGGALAAAIAAALLSATAAHCTRSAMKETASTCRVTNSKELAANLREALLGEHPAFFEGLYDAEAIEDDGLRPLVAGARDETMRLFKMARDKLQPVSCEVVSEEQQGTSRVVRFLINGKTQLEVLVDDVYERGGCLHTRDVMQFKVIS